MRSTKSWDQMTVAEKTDKLHRDLGDFITFSNEQAIKRNAAFDGLGERLKQAEKALKRIETQLAKLERKNEP